MIRRNLGWLILIFMAAVFVFFFLTGCAGPKSEPGNAGGYTPGQTYDAEDYNGPAQAVTGWDYEPAEKGTRTKKTPYCKKPANKNKAACKEEYVKDDADWYLVLADTTRVDVDEATQARYLVGAIYP